MLLRDLQGAWQIHVMLRIAHLATALALLAAHGTFLGRGLYLRRVGQGPAALDRVARTLSQLLLPLCAFLGLLVFPARASRPLLLHLLLGLAPLAAIILVFAGRLVLRRRTEAPWLLPALNLALIAAALASGFAAAGG
jgi:hypothetical protein